MGWTEGHRLQFGGTVGEITTERLRIACQINSAVFSVGARSALWRMYLVSAVVFLTNEVSFLLFSD